MSLGTPEVLLCLLVALIVLGPDQLPKAARQAGKALAELKKFSASMQAQVQDMVEADEKADEDENPRERSAPIDDRDTEGFKLVGYTAPDRAEGVSPVTAREIDRDYSQSGEGTIHRQDGDQDVPEVDRQSQPNTE